MIFEKILFGSAGGLYNKLNKFLMRPSCGINVVDELVDHDLHTLKLSK